MIGLRPIVGLGRVLLGMLGATNSPGPRGRRGPTRESSPPRTDDDRGPALHELVDRYLEACERLERIGAHALRRVAVSGQVDRLAAAIAAKAGRDVALPTRGLVLVPVDGPRDRPPAYRVLRSRDVDMEAFLDYERDLIRSTRALIDRGTPRGVDRMDLGAEVQITTGATPDEADRVVHEFGTLDPDEAPADLIAWKATATRLLERTRLGVGFGPSRGAS